METGYGDETAPLDVYPFGYIPNFMASRVDGSGVDVSSVVATFSPESDVHVMFATTTVLALGDLSDFVAEVKHCKVSNHDGETE